MLWPSGGGGWPAWKGWSPHTTCPPLPLPPTAFLSCWACECSCLPGRLNPFSPRFRNRASNLPRGFWCYVTCSWQHLLEQDCCVLCPPARLPAQATRLPDTDTQAAQHRTLPTRTEVSFLGAIWVPGSSLKPLACPSRWPLPFITP